MGKPGQLAIGVIPAGGDTPQKEWKRIAVDHQWADKPRWAPDGKTMYFVSPKPTGYFNVWGVRLNRDMSPVGEPFQITHFDTPGLMINPEIGYAEMDIAGDRLAVTLRSVSGGIWLLTGVER